VGGLVQAPDLGWSADEKPSAWAIIDADWYDEPWLVSDVAKDPNQEGYDLHLLAGQSEPLARHLRLKFFDPTQPDKPYWFGFATELTAGDVPAEAIALANQIGFQFSFGQTAPATVHGVTLGKDGSITIADPFPADGLHNFICVISFPNYTSNGGTSYRAEPLTIRAHAHSALKSISLTPATLSVRTGGARFTLLAEFDDGTLGDLSRSSDVSWSSDSVPGFVFNLRSGEITPADPASLPKLNVQVTAQLGTFQAKAAANVFPPWTSDNTPGVLHVRSDAYPTVHELDSHENILFLADGFRDADREIFIGVMIDFVTQVRTSSATSPLHYCADKINFLYTFLPSNDQGSSVLNELVPSTDVPMIGTPVLLDDRPPSPDPAADHLAQLLYQVGLPVPSDATPDTTALDRFKAKWVPLGVAVPPSDLFKQWLALSERRLANEKDTMFGLAFGHRPGLGDGLDLHTSRTLLRHPLRSDHIKQLLDSLVVRNVDGSLIADETKRPLLANRRFTVSIITAFTRRGGTDSAGLSFASLEKDRHPRISFLPNSRAVEIEPADPATLVDNQGVPHCPELARETIVHEWGHAFGLGDEYGEETTPATSDPGFGNLQFFAKPPLSSQIKWNWPRITDVRVVTAATEVSPSVWKLTLQPVGPSGPPSFSGGDHAMLRVRDPANQGSPFQDFPAPVQDADDASATVNLALGPATVGPGTILYLPRRNSSGDILTMIARDVQAWIDKNGPLWTTPRDPATGNVLPSYSTTITEPPPGEEDQPPFDHLTPPTIWLPGDQTKVIGLYEQGAREYLGIYHPGGSCVMRHGVAPLRSYCAVCRYLIVDRIDPMQHRSIEMDYMHENGET
jgi:hypothetical protein